MKSVSDTPDLREAKIILGMGGVFEGKESSAYSILDYISILQEAIALGYRFIDTAPAYADGLSEEIVGKAVSGLRPEVFVATKVSPEALTPSLLRKSVDASLRRLRTDYIDLLQVHWPNPSVPLEETANAMLALLSSGKILKVGVANFSVPKLQDFDRFFSNECFISSQVEISLIDRFEITRSHEWVLEKNKVTLAYSPLGKGRLVEGSEVRAKLNSLARSNGVTNSQLCLAWLSDLGNLVPIVASRNLAHLRENLVGTEISVDARDLRELSAYLTDPDVKLVVPSSITVAVDGDGNKSAYHTVQEAIENRFGMTPSPEDLARELGTSRDIKPVRVQTRVDGLYLIEGRLRYWAWVIAFGDSQLIPVTEVSTVVN